MLLRASVAASRVPYRTRVKPLEQTIVPSPSPSPSSQGT